MASQWRTVRGVRFHRVDQEDGDPQVEVQLGGGSSDEAEDQGEDGMTQVQLLSETDRSSELPAGKKMKSGTMKTRFLFISAFLVVILMAVGITIAIRLLVCGKPSASGATPSTWVTSPVSQYCPDSRPEILPSLNYSGSKDGTCSGFSLKSVWDTHYVNLSSTSAVRFVDVNCDGVLDIVLGFTSSVEWPNEMGYNELVHCLSWTMSRYKLPNYCYGGVMAIDGRTGEELWRKSTTHEVFAIQCSIDINNDGYLDCFAAGRGGVFFSVEARSGNVLWMSDDKVTNYTWNFLTPQVVRDFDNDGIQDIVVSHGGDRRYDDYDTHRGVGLLLLLSGRTGKALSAMKMPDSHETYMSPILHRRNAGSVWVLFGSGGESVVGNLWAVELEEFAQLGFKYDENVGMLDSGTASTTRRIISGTKHMGASNPPVLVDLNDDGILDVVMPMFDGRVIAINGKDYNKLWSVDFGQAESYVYPCIGHFGGDSVPDIMVIYQMGEYGEYDSTIVAVIDGGTGKSLYRSESKVGLRMASAPLSVHMLHGNDWFIYWKAEEESNDKTTAIGSHESRRHEDESLDEIQSNNVQLLAKNLETEGNGQTLMRVQTGVHEDFVSLYNVSFTMELALLNTPAIADVDGNGKLDVVFALSRKTCPLPEKYESSGMSRLEMMKQCHGTVLDLYRKELDSDCPVASMVQQPWFSYLGTHGDGVYIL